MKKKIVIEEEVIEVEEPPKGRVLKSVERIDNKYWIPPRGNPEAKIMVICSHPTKDDLDVKVLFGQGMSNNASLGANELEGALKEAGIAIDDIWITSMVKYGIGAKDKPTKQQIAECADYLDAEIDLVKPKIIVALGSEVFKRIMKKNIKVSSYLGEIIDSPYHNDEGVIKVLPQYSVGNIYAVDPKLRPEFKDIFYLAKRYADGNLNYKEFKWIVVTDPAVNTKILKKYMDAGKWSIGYDMEWEGDFMKGRIPYTFQYCCEPDKAVVLPIVDDKGNVNMELLMTMKEFLEHPKADRLGWNIRADDKALAELGIHPLDETLGFDGMKAVAFFDSRWRKGLDTGIKRFTNYAPYYNALSEALVKYKLKYDKLAQLMFLEPEIFYKYCAGDAVSHFTACNEMRRQLKTVPGLIKTGKYYFETYLPLTHYLLDMEVTGLPIDIPLMEDITDKYNQCYNILAERLNTILNNLGFNTVEYEKSVALIGEEATKTNELYPDFNPRSFHDKRRLFFNKMGLEPVYYVRKGKVKPKTWYDKQKDFVKLQYAPSTNGKTMASIRFQLAEQLLKEPDNEDLKTKFNIVKNYLDLARVSVFAKKFLAKQGTEYAETDEEDFDDEDQEADEQITAAVPGKKLKSSYWAGLCQDQRIHADFFECLNNFRSSSKPNVQNPASKVLSHIPTIFKDVGVEEPKNIRNIFYAGHPDWHFAEVDVAGADLAIAAFLSGDPDYIRDILNGGFHVTKMREYFNNNALGKGDASKYVTAKSITFRVAYTAGLMSAALPIQAEIYAENGNLVELSVIEYALKTWERYKTYMAYRDDCNAQVTNYQWIENARGMKYYFEESNNFAIKAGWMNESLAYPIASELALFLWDVSVQIKAQLKRDKNWLKWIKPVNTVHDASYWIVHKDMMKDGYFPDICKEYFTKKVTIATGDNLGIEMVVADRWKGKEKVFNNETVWDFEKKYWKWKP